MDDDEIRDRLKRFQREMTDVSETIVSFGKRKADTADVELVARKLGVLEEEARLRFGSIQSDNAEIRNALRSVGESLKALKESVDALHLDLTHHKKEMVEELKDKGRAAWFSKMPPWVWLLMGIGLFALLEIGPQKWAEIKALAP